MNSPNKADLTAASGQTLPAPAFTPGPWRLTPRFQSKVDVIHDDPREGAASTTVARVTVRDTWLVQQSANARLIAAAPELCADLRKAAEVFRQYEDLHRAKGTAEGDAKADVNAALASRFEATLRKVDAS